ncbi:ABC transporter permease [Dankookia sp. P2]|uniref:ABC transporter permease n=1 Tax=Dankookia sp. P2 TaxID=3423955 RepID=UPI003D668F69
MTAVSTKPAPAPAQMSRPLLAKLPQPSRVAPMLANVIPPLMILAVFLGLWEFLASGPAATLPPPSKVWADSYDLITDPFFDRGGLDKGLFWHLAASLQRVALGFTIAGVVGILTGLLIGTSPSPCAGSTRSSRCCAPCRRWPGCRSRSPLSARRSPARSS